MLLKINLHLLGGLVLLSVGVVNCQISCPLDDQTPASPLQESFNELDEVLNKKIGNNFYVMYIGQVMDTLKKVVNQNSSAWSAFDLVLSISKFNSDVRFHCDDRILKLLVDLASGSRLNPAYAKKFTLDDYDKWLSNKEVPEELDESYKNLLRSLRLVDLLADRQGAEAAKKCNKYLDEKFTQLMSSVQSGAQSIDDKNWRSFMLLELLPDDPTFYNCKPWLVEPKFDLSLDFWDDVISDLIDESGSSTLVFGQLRHNSTGGLRDLLDEPANRSMSKSDYLTLVEQLIYKPCERFNKIFGEFVPQFYSVGQYALTHSCFQDQVKREFFKLDRPKGLLEVIYRYEMCRQAPGLLSDVGEHSVYSLLMMDR